MKNSLIKSITSELNITSDIKNISIVDLIKLKLNSKKVDNIMLSYVKSSPNISLDEKYVIDLNLSEFRKTMNLLEQNYFNNLLLNIYFIIGNPYSIDSHDFIKLAEDKSNVIQKSAAYIILILEKMLQTNDLYKFYNHCIIEKWTKSIINKPFLLQDHKGNFDESQYFKMNKTLKLFEKNDVRVRRQHVLNELTKHLVEKEMLPALCYVFSRKQLEICAKEVTTNLLEFDSKVPYIVDRECEHIIRKLPNYQEYLHLPEYVNMVALLRKGIAIHHSGVTPILREMVELLFAKGYIKFLFC